MILPSFSVLAVEPKHWARNELSGRLPKLIGFLISLVELAAPFGTATLPLAYPKKLKYPYEYNP